MNAPVRDYPHPELNSEIRAIGGHYVVVKEARLPFQGEELLYFIGHGIADRTCCGFGAFCYASVAGFVRQWKYARNADNQWLSKVEPVTDAREQDQIKKLIKQHEPMISQVNFMPG
jgi:hypothetical protein